MVIGSPSSSMPNAATYIPVVLRTMVIEPERILLEDLADELDYILDTKPPEWIKAIIARVLAHLAGNGVRLAKRKESSGEGRTPKGNAPKTRPKALRS